MVTVSVGFLRAEGVPDSTSLEPRNEWHWLHPVAIERIVFWWLEFHEIWLLNLLSRVISNLWTGYVDLRLLSNILAEIHRSILRYSLGARNYKKTCQPVAVKLRIRLEYRYFKRSLTTDHMEIIPLIPRGFRTFSMSRGNYPPGESCWVTFKWVSPVT